MTFTAEEIRKNYEGFSNEKLMRIATENAGTLSPEVVSILKEELRKRQLIDEDIERSIAIQAKELTEQELEAFINLIETLPCPICSTTSQRLNLSSVFSVTSFIIITQFKGKNVIACPDCLVKSLRRADTSTFLLGLWGIPWGVIRSVKALVNNSISRKRVHQRSPLMKEFVKLKKGEIERWKNDSTNLLNLVKRNNEYVG
ncbi:hypothetical protein QNI19_04720 [Cytophagaceae bacterium DM2B3-1]|uniref:Uncharacterized protein n=1 Tax=Xanthocytophaga flava TaxID=3048013 RepID=A0ABT7CF13_9BACT|nr:hypothetical protein [Xanthocytophaga flavus]MDJ1469047.1 hypothetical protein [Xanthocytophaga flavus]MDJ1492222.1 hypothetical protein [Xanthocytophaga flavus]